MRYLRKYESHKDIDRIAISNICLKYGISNYTINDDGSIDVDGNVNLSHKRFKKLPLNFRTVSKTFWADFNKLTSIDGSPKSVTNYFCDNNRLTSLVGCPQLIKGNLMCSYNEIETFDGLNFIEIGKEFDCYGNPIWSIWKLFRDYTKFEFFNDCDIIRENRIIILDRLNFFFDYIDKPTVTEVEGYKCI
jgi:hypothetical protein